MKKTNFERYRDIAPKNRKNKEKLTKIIHLEIRRREKMFFYCLKTEKEKS